MIDVDPVAKELGERFNAAGFELYLVGGVVRDAMLGRTSPDMDLATSAKPHETTKVLQGWADNRYHVGVRFGTVGARKGTQLFEITTFREEVYAEEHRKPAVTFAKDIQTDLSRRDFTINAMAVRLPGRRVHRPVRRGEAPGGEDAGHAARARDRVLRRSVAHVAGRAVRVAAGRDAVRTRRARHHRDARTPVDRVRRADPCRAGPAARRREAVGGTGADRRDGPVRPVPPGALRAAARAGSGASAQGRAAAHVRRRRTVRAGPGASAGRRCCTTSASRRRGRSRRTACSSIITRSSARAWPRRG